MLNELAESTCDESWQKIIDIWKESKEVFHGPTRGNYPDAYSIYRLVIDRRKDARTRLMASLDHENPIVVGYCLAALDEILGEVPQEAINKIAHREEKIEESVGCFSSEQTLLEFVNNVLNDNEST